MNIMDYNFTATQDWAPFFQQIFSCVKITNFLEFGLGLGTKFLCDNCDHVTSVELSIGEFNKKWAEETKLNLKDYQNWTLNYIELPEELITANNCAIENKYPLNDLRYLTTLKNLILPILSAKNYDMIFVDPGIHNRGDIINLCFNFSDIIAAHDTDRTGRIIPNIYGYNIVEVPNNYKEIHFNDTYCGTTIWLNKNNDNFLNLQRVLQP